LNYAPNEPNTAKITRMSDFKDDRFEKDNILLCLHWYPANPLSYRIWVKELRSQTFHMDQDPRSNSLNVAVLLNTV
jgi:hypothetical protein